MSAEREKLGDVAGSVQALLALEMHVLEAARSAGFDAVLATNTHPATQDAAAALGYKVDKVIGNLNERRDKNGEALYDHAPVDWVFKVAHAEL